MKSIIIAIAIFAFALPALAVDATYQPAATKVNLLSGVHVATDNYRLVIYDKDGTCDATTFATYTATGLVGMPVMTSAHRQLAHQGLMPLSINLLHSALMIPILLPRPQL